jgi:hypothetical protein
MSLVPLNVAPVGLQALHNCCPTLTTLTNPLVTLPIVCSTPMLPIVYCHYIFLQLWSIVCNNLIYFANFNLQVFPFPIATYWLIPSCDTNDFLYSKD